jgi:hypothetical protein
MRPISIIVCVLLISSVARGGAFVELVPDNPGPYFGGETLNVDVLIHNEDAESHLLRLIQWDFSVSDPALTVGPSFDWNLSPAQRSLHVVESELPRPGIAWGAEFPIPEFMVSLPASGLLNSGTVQLLLPPDLGVFRLDVFNASELNENLGGLIVFGGHGSPTSRWRADGTGDGLLTGGMLDFHVIPEPATHLLCLTGLMFFARYRSRR